MQLVDAARPHVKGPARGLWQFELGKKGTGAGVWGVFEHVASRYWLSHVCEALQVEFHPRAIWPSLENNDRLACCVARLLLFTDPRRLPEIGDADGAWNLYRYRTWRPGKPHRDMWAGNYAAAVAEAT